LFFIRAFFTHRIELAAEILALRQQLAILNTIYLVEGLK